MKLFGITMTENFGIFFSKYQDLDLSVDARLQGVEKRRIAEIYRVVIKMMTENLTSLLMKNQY